MKAFITTSVLFFCMLANAQVNTIAPGQPAPAIKLKNIDGKLTGFDDYPSAKGFIVVFTCNTCPYSRAYEKRIIDLNNKFLPQGFPVIAINPNDPEFSAGDTFDKMKTHSQDAQFNFPYLYDEGQVVTNLYGAKNTPHVFIVSKTPNGNVVQYTGAIDNDTQNTDPAKLKYTENAVEALLKNDKPPVTVTKAIGCRIKRG